MDRQPELALGADPNPTQSAPASHETQGEAIKPHAFSRLPSVGIPDRAAREWAVADIEGLKQIATPADRKLPLAIMAFNMSDNRPYRAALQELAPDIAAEVRDVGVHEVEQGTGLLHDHRTRSDREQREKDELTRLSSGLDARMAKANLSELGWRDRGDLGSMMEDLCGGQVNSDTTIGFFTAMFRS
jgi:hypothetical protein